MPAKITSDLRLRYRMKVDAVYLEWLNARGGVVAQRKAWDTELALIEKIERLKAELRHARGVGPAPTQIESGLKMMTNLKGVKTR